MRGKSMDEPGKDAAASDDGAALAMEIMERLHARPDAYDVALVVCAMTALADGVGEAAIVGDLRAALGSLRGCMFGAGVGGAH